MILLSVSITMALLIIIGLPIAGAIFVTKKRGVSWRVISYGALGYLIVQALVSIILNGLSNLIQNWETAAADGTYLLSQVLISVLLGTLLGVLIRWLGMKYLKLGGLQSAYGISIGYGGVESLMLVGLPLLMTFITMLSNVNIDPESTTLEPAVVQQLQELWELQFFVPLATAVERLAALIMHFAVTILVLQVFIRRKHLWLAAAFGLEFLVNFAVVGLSELGVDYGWVILASVLFMVLNVFLLFKLNAFNLLFNHERQETQDQSL